MIGNLPMKFEFSTGGMFVIEYATRVLDNMLKAIFFKKKYFVFF